MKRLLLVFALLAVAACTGDSNLPVPTGKGTLRSINAIVASPSVVFRIKERALGTLAYKQSSQGVRFDDIEYDFNFDVQFPGEPEQTRITSQLQKIEAEKDYSFVLSGSIDDPTITTWVGDERDWDGSETVFEVRFAHLSVSLGAIDVYFAPDGTAPASGDKHGTLNFGEILAPIDFEIGDYVFIVTPMGTPGTVLFQSTDLTYIAQSDVILPIFDGDETDTGSLVAQRINAGGASLRTPDAASLPTTRFIQASLDLPNSDVYDDAALANLVLANHAYGDVTGDLQVAQGSTTYTYTTVGSTNTVFEDDINTNLGVHYNFIVFGEQGERVALTFVPDRRSVSTAAKISVIKTSVKQQTRDFYVVDAGTPIDDVLPQLVVVSAQLAPTLPLVAGSYDLYLTTRGEKTVIAGPERLDLVLGDVAEVIFFDTVDPATAEIRILPTL